MTEVIQRSIFDFQDRIIPKVKRTIPITDWDGELERILPMDAEAMVSAIKGKLTTAGHWARFLPKKAYDHDDNGAITTVKGTYLTYWIMHYFYFANFDYITGERTEHYIRICKPTYVNGKPVGNNMRTPTDAYIEGDTLFIDCDDGQTYSVMISDDARIDLLDCFPFEPTKHTEHLLLDLFIKGARGDELLPVMTYGPCHLTELHGRSEQACQIQDIARKYGIDIKMPYTVDEWSPEHYPNQESCKNCTRYRRESKACQIGGKFTDEKYVCCSSWHWNGTPFKKLAKKKKQVEEDEDYDEEGDE